MKFSIQKLSSQNLALANKLYNHFVQTSFSSWDIYERTTEQAHQWYESHQNQRCPVYSVSTNDKFCGYCSLSPFSHRDGYIKTAEISIYIDPYFQGKGAGTVSLEFLIHIAKEIGHHQLLALIDDENQSSITLFTNYGFSMGGFLPEVGHKNNSYRNLLIYYKSI